MIEVLPGFPDSVLAVVGRGQITRDDYESVLIPAVEAALRRHSTVNLYYEIAEDFSGIEPGAVWEDFLVGVEHVSRWGRIAFVSDEDWIRHAVRAFGFLFPGRLRLFSLGDAAAARAWIEGEDA